MEVSQVYAEGWKKKVEEVWQPAHKAGIKRSVSPCDSENVVGKDKIMPGLKVTEETYDGCKQSFIAADEHHEKASKKYFDDTGIMAAVCRCRQDNNPPHESFVESDSRARMSYHNHPKSCLHSI